MKRVILIAALTLGPAFASTRHMIDTLGTSAKGQFVAIEEYGFNSEKGTFYSQMRILNVWTSRYVETPVRVELRANSRNDLLRTRKKARTLFSPKLQKYKIGLQVSV